MSGSDSRKNMRTKILSIFAFALLLLLVSTGKSFAATSVRLQTPSNPTNQKNLTLTFVAQTTTSNSLTAQCKMQGPADGDFVNIGGTISLGTGNTNTCSFNLNQGDGNYNFQVEVTGDGDVVSSVSTNLNTSGPGTPTYYKKEKIDSCTYKITFHTAADSGKTSKVVLYRSSDTNFPLDSAHKVNEVVIGSDQDGSFTNDISPDCNSTFYYAVRAFDSSGNPSGALGDAETVTVNPTGTTGAIPVVGGQSSVLGSKTSTNGTTPTVTGEKEKSGDVLGTQTKEETNNTSVSNNPLTKSVNWVTGHKKISLIVLAFIGLAIYLFLRYRKTQTP